jgi:excisionase family DNA binding protein
VTARPRRQHEPKPGSGTLSRRSSDPAPPSETTTIDGPGQDSPSGRLAYSVDEAARLTGLSRDLFYDEMRRGNLAYVKVGRRRLITRQHLNQFLGIAS